MDLDRKLSTPLLIIPALLVVIYSMLSIVALFNQTSFFDSMEIPIPEHRFMIFSWAGKNTAIVVGLVLAILSRRLRPLLIMMAVLLTMQLGDINAGLITDVNVFITWIAFALLALEALVLDRSGAFASERTTAG